MTRTARAAAIAALTVLAAIAAIIAADLTPPASAQSDDETSGRIVARRLSDGRTELGWQPRTNAGWGERILPRARYLPAAPTVGRWLRTSPIEVEGVEIGRVEARKRRDGGIELAFTPTGRERILPSSNYLPANAQLNRWLNGTEIRIGSLKIAFLADYSGAIAEFGPAIETGVRLAVKHLNDAGGVFGQDVQVVTGDTGLDSTRAVEEARRLIEVEGAHAIVGPLASPITLAVAESVTGPANIPTISPSAISSQITLADDNGFLFRSTVSDAAQGPVLAQLAADEGYSNVSILYVDNAYGQGLADAFLEAWGGESVSVAYAEGQTSYLAELQNVAGANGEVLIAVGYPTEAQVYIREALENGIFDTFLFVDGTKSQDLIDAIGQGFLNGMKGTARARGPENDSLRNFNAAYRAEYGTLPSLPFVREAYDAAVAIGLAAASAGSTDGVRLRDHLRAVAAPDGAVISAGAEGVAAGLRALANGESVNYEGAATTVDWNAAGDVTTGFIGVWQFANGGIEEVSVQAIDLGAGASVAIPRDTGAVDVDNRSGIENEAPIFAGMIEPQTWVLGERISLELPRAHGGSGAITYSVIRRASGAVAEWRGSGPLPAITFDEDAHQLQGVAIGPVGAGYSIELKATDANGAIERMSFTVELVEPQQVVEPDAARRIAKAYAPVLLRDRNEKFKPVAINAMLEQSALVQDGRDSPLHSTGDVLEVDLLRYNGRDMHLDLFHGRNGTNEKEWAKVQARYPATVYARVFLQDGQHLIVQYWFFYVYNNGPGGGVGEDHEGDWEGIQLVFPSGASHPLLTGETMTTLLRPTWLGYASHNHGDMYLSGEVRWRTYSGLASRPVVYVAEGSHASYAYRVASRVGLRNCERDCDIARGDHPTGLVEGETYHLEMINGDEWWLAWTGTWGKDHIRGPMVQGRRWSTPICWPGWRVVSERYAATFNTLRDC